MSVSSIDRNPPRRSAWLPWLLVLLFLGNAGCGNFRFYVSSPVDVDTLESRLRVKESTCKDVLAVLGEPEGKGREMLPITGAPRTMWSYYYEEGSIQDSRRIFLFLYFDGDLLDGYMWFSSLPKHAGKGL